MRAKRKASIRAYSAEGGADYGPALRPRADGRLVAWGGAAVVEVGSRFDPEITDRQRVVRGARRRDVLIDLESRRAITKRMRDAAEQFLEDCSIAAGASAGDAVGLPAVAGPRSGLPERQVAAIGRITQVRVLLGLNSGTVFWWVVFFNRSIHEYERVHRLRNGTGAEMFRQALEALDEHYHRHSARNRA